MKKLFGIVAVVAALLLLAAPALAAPTLSAPVTVTITVAEYCGIVEAPGNLTMGVSDVQASAVASEGQHQATTTFKAQGNMDFNVALTVNETTGAVIVTAGMEGLVGALYPTARLDDNNAIGYGMALSNTTTPATDGWTPDDGNCNLVFPAGLSDGQIKINSYLDSGRSTILGYAGKLAAPGIYNGTVTMTLSL